MSIKSIIEFVIQSIVYNIYFKGGFIVMNNFVITCCSTVDLEKEYLEKRNIPYVCFHYTLDEIEYPDDLGVSISADVFFDKIAKGATPTTSQVNSEQYIKFWEPFLEKGQNILHVTLSSGISGSYNSAMLAKRYLEEKYPNLKIKVVDSLGASSGYGLLMSYLADLRDEGKTFDACYEWAEANKLNVHHWFFSTDLTSYKRGGRISTTSFFLGQLLKICPLLNMDNLGRLIPRKKVRTKEKTMVEIVKRMEEHAQDGYNYSGKCYMCHSACLDDAKKVASMVEAKFPNLNGRVVINNIGTVIGSHTGPGTIALFFMGDKREN